MALGSQARLPASWTKHAADTSPLTDLNKPPDRLQTFPSCLYVPLLYQSSLSITLKKILGQHDIKVTNSSSTTLRDLLTKTQDYSLPYSNTSHHVQNLLPGLPFYLRRPDLSTPYIPTSCAFTWRYPFFSLASTGFSFLFSYCWKLDCLVTKRPWALFFISLFFL